MTGQITLRPWSAQPQHAGIWRVGIDHPGKLNAMSRAMWVALRETLQAVNARSDVRCLVVQGEGAAFCAGGDIAEYPGFRFDEAQLTHFHEGEVWGGLQALLDCPVPVVAAIRGACMGAGVEISSCCDLRVATEDAKFGAPIARLGFPMAPRELELVGREVGSMVARRMLLEAAVFSAAEMAQHGFLGPVVAAEQLDAVVQATAEKVAALSPLAARLNKQAMRSLAQGGVPAVVQPYAYADDAEHREGIHAFLEKRKPQF
ncbi:enoyl-CoA hydratase/isomerase family protein [Comamonas sp. UBA7528]|uniref:enoyl-CoA hydratase/isomerase family protein n=1 Tax=Comamonas sp. UBA7528 TaxID=1946391 RepID=UPI0025BDBCDE|nr:enoyl-CoA hydratase-related protein [Comamonas sp. UBA7528]